MRTFCFWLLLIVMSIANPLQAQVDTLLDRELFDEAVPDIKGDGPSLFIQIISDCIEVFSFRVPGSIDMESLEGRVFLQDDYDEIVNADCLPETSIRSVVKVDFDCIARKGYNLRFNTLKLCLHIGDQMISEQTINENENTYTFDVPWTEGIMQELSLPSNERVYLQLYRDGPLLSNDRIELEGANVLFVENGYSFERLVEHPTVFETICDQEELGDIDDVHKLCGATGTIITLTAKSETQNSEETSTKTSRKISLKSAVTGTGEGGIPYTDSKYKVEVSVNAELERVITVTNTSTEISGNSEEEVLPIEGQAGSCTYPGLVINMHLEETRNYEIADCSATLHEEDEDTLRRYVIERIGMQLCAESTTDCSEVDCEVEVEGNDDDDDGGNRLRPSECTANLIASHVPEPDFGLSILWFNENNELQGVGEVLENVPYGIYYMQVNTACGDEFVDRIIACPGEVVESDWTFDEEKNQLCRSITCSGEEDCEGFTETLCINPTFTDWSYNAKTQEVCRQVFCPSDEVCIGIPEEGLTQCFPAEFSEWDYFDDGFEAQCFRTVSVLGELLEDVYDYSQPSITYDYDEFLETCYEIIRCGETDALSDIVASIEEDPTFGEWQTIQDGFEEVCVREVFCFEQSGSEVVQEENTFPEDWEDRNENPEIEWTYEEWDGCVGYVYCDDDDFPGNQWDADVELDGEPIVNEEVDSRFDQVFCVIDVSCQYEFDTYPTSYYDEYEAVPYDAQFVGDVQSVAYCEFYYQCGDEVTSIDAPYVVDSYEEVVDGQTLVWCVPYCNGFKESTEQSRVLCNTINGINPGIDKSLIEQDNQAVTLSTQSQLSMSEASPNPFSARISLRNIPISLAQYKVQIVDLTGVLVVESIIAGDAEQHDLETGNIIPGLYFLNIINAEGQVVLQQKMVKAQ